MPHSSTRPSLLHVRHYRKRLRRSKASDAGLVFPDKRKPSFFRKKPFFRRVSKTVVFCDFSRVNVCISGKSGKETRVFCDTLLTPSRLLRIHLVFLYSL